MNEQIKELWWKARIGYNEQNCDPEVLAKFAELIVAECIDTVSDCSVEYCTRPQIVSEIKQHFGVEE